MSQRKRILVIEDDAAIRRAVVDALTITGYEVDQSGRGDEGLAKALQGAANLVLLDLVLPKGSGWTILRQLRAEQSTIPVIILTACGRESDRVEGLQADRQWLMPTRAPRAFVQATLIVELQTVKYFFAIFSTRIHDHGLQPFKNKCLPYLGKSF